MNPHTLPDIKCVIFSSLQGWYRLQTIHDRNLPNPYHFCLRNWNIVLKCSKRNDFCV